MKKGVHKPTYRSWQMMKNRCGNPNATDFKYYGGRGITYTPSWGTYENFLADMGERPDTLTLERKDVHSGYSRANCVWADRTTQARNRDYVLTISYQGEELKSWEWAEKLKLKQATFHHRLWQFRNGNISESELFKPNPRAK